MEDVDDDGAVGRKPWFVDDDNDDNAVAIDPIRCEAPNAGGWGVA